MIKSVKVINHLGEEKTFILSDPYQSGFIVTNIEGIGPPKANIGITDVATTDGGKYNSARTDTRNIVLYLQLLEHPTVESVRHEAYKFFPVKKKITLVFETDTRTCEAYGYVETNEPDIFSDKEAIQVSVVCPDPYFYSQVTNLTVFFGVEAAFEFIFSNESLDESLLIMGEIRQRTEEYVIYEGDEETGIIIHLHASGPANNIHIYNMKTREHMFIDTTKLQSLTGSGVKESDEIIISTVKGDKYARLLRDGHYQNILNCLDKNTAWFQLSKGENIFAIVADTGVYNLQFEIENRTLFEGV